MPNRTALSPLDDRPDTSRKDIDITLRALREILLNMQHGRIQINVTHSKIRSVEQTSSHLLKEMPDGVMEFD